MYKINKKNLWFISLFLFILTGCEDEKKIEDNNTKLRSVKYTIVSQSNNERSFIYSGTSKASFESILSFRVEGRIQSLPVKVGDLLFDKSLVASLDRTPFILEVEKARALLSEYKSEQRNKFSIYNRNKALYENNNLSKEDLDSSRTALESAKAKVNSAYKSLKLKELDLSYTKLTGKSNCSVSEVFKEVNENVKSTDQVISIICGKNINIETFIPEDLINSVYKDMHTMISFDAIKDKSFKAKVTEVSVSASSGVGYLVILTIEDETSQLRPGMSAQVKFNFLNNQKTNKIYLPPVSVRKDNNGNFVYLLESTNEKGVGLIKRQSVEVGELVSLGIEIIDGVNIGDRVVTAGMSKIYDGFKVREE